MEDTLQRCNPAALILRYWPTLQQVAKYGLVGLWGVALHLAIIALCMELLGLPYWGGFLAALPFTYSTKFALNKYWTFGSRGYRKLWGISAGTERSSRSWRTRRSATCLSGGSRRRWTTTR